MDEQSYRDFELIVVDQNPDKRLISMLEFYRVRFPLVHLTSRVRGLSRARNLGLKHITGEVVAFPDDDCWYPPNALKLVADLLWARPEWDGASGRSLDETGGRSHANWPRRAMEVGQFRLWAISFATFVRRPIVEAVGDFDEELGVGAGTPWGSSEEADYFLRALKAGFRIFYDPKLFIIHPQPLAAYDATAFRRAYSYAMGQGRLLRMHRYPSTVVLYRSLRSLGGSVLALASGRRGKAIYHWKVFEGRLRGWTA